MPEVMFKLAALAHQPVHLGVEEACHSARPFLGAVERDIGIVAERLGGDRVGRKKRDPDAAPYRHRIARDVDLFGKAVVDPPRETLRVPEVLDAALDDQEFVAPDASDEVDVTRCASKEACHPAQDRIARAVAEEVVHGFEAVEIERQQREMLAAFRKAFEKGRKTGAVGQPGQCVVRREMFDLQLCAPARGKVANGQNLAGLSAIFDTMRGDLDDHFLAVATKDRRLGGPLACCCQRQPVCGLAIGAKERPAMRKESQKNRMANITDSVVSCGSKRSGIGPS